ncbi:MAG: polysaccharide biosynthesis/export family protein [Myxococcales bacterium]|nr:polysaccharide biosynthesis/export family protein [Myxococcales bacterium]
MWVTDLPIEQDEDKILIGDELAVEVKDQEKLSGLFPVRANGTYAQPVVGEIPVQGLTEPEAAQLLARLLKGIVVEPRVTITINKRKAIDVPVLGEVRSVGVVSLPLDSSMHELLAKVGGLNEFASKSGIYILRKDPKLTRIRFDYDALLGGERHHAEFKLKEGDVLVVK